MVYKETEYSSVEGFAEKKELHVGDYWCNLKLSVCLTRE